MRSDNKGQKYPSTPDDKPIYAAITIDAWTSVRNETIQLLVGIRVVGQVSSAQISGMQIEPWSLGKMSRNLRCTTGSCGWCAIVVLSFAPLRIVNNDVSGSIRLAEFFDSPLPVSSWLIETVVEGTTACNCSFRETKVLPGFCAR